MYLGFLPPTPDRWFYQPLSPNILIQILQTDLHTFSKRIGWEYIKKDQKSKHFPWGDHFYVFFW